MPRILILGATGYIGSALGSSLLRHNHKVYNLARTPAKANQLARLEMIPVIGSIQDPGAYIQLIETAAIVDVVVDCSGAKPRERRNTLRRHGSGRAEVEGS